ncbi:unnamed protein product [Somion occarium]|uniref:Uncharacterized protein n=1 Tax=Somion occarium TaxID=3059160 RepID=A0ABP1E041_9APHY
MIAFTYVLLPLLAFSSAAFPVPVTSDPPTIDHPAPGTHIAPGAAFDFSYNGLADYGKSSYGFHVWLLGDDALNKTLSPTDFFTNGYYFGKFDYPNYPAIPYAQHPAPAQFIMPDFSKPQGGFGGGKAVSDYKFQFVVFEEWADGAGEVGRKLAVTANEIIYNATTS